MIKLNSADYSWDYANLYIVCNWLIRNVKEYFVFRYKRRKSSNNWAAVFVSNKDYARW